MIGQDHQKMYQDYVSSSSIKIYSPKIAKQFLLRTIKKIGASTVALLLLASCGNRETLLAEINDFNKSVQVGSESIAAYYSSINEQELQLYMLILELNPNCEASININYNCLDPKFQPPGRQEDNFASPLKQPAIPLESIQVRISLLKEIADYSKSLGALAGDNSAEKFQGTIKTLQSRLSSLENKFRQLEKSDSKSTSTDVNISNRYINPITTIIGILGKTSIQEAKWSEIRKSIVEADEPIGKVLTAVADDLDTYASPLTIIAAKKRYIVLINYYNLNRFKLNQAERASVLAKIVNYKKSYDLVSANKPSQIPNDILSAHKILVKLAKSDGSIRDLAELRAWLEKFKNDAEQLKDAVNQLVEI